MFPINDDDIVYTKIERYYLKMKNVLIDIFHEELDSIITAAKLLNYTVSYDKVKDYPVLYLQKDKIRFLMTFLRTEQFIFTKLKLEVAGLEVYEDIFDKKITKIEDIKVSFNLFKTLL